MQSGQLVIRPVSAQLTHDTEWFGSMDCYCRIMVGANAFRTMAAHDQGTHPNWQETFTAFVNGDQMMRVAIYDRDNCSDDDYVCETMIPLQEVYMRRQVSNWFPVQRRGRPAGQIMIMLEFHPQGMGGMGMQPGMGMGMGMQPGMGMGGMGMGMGMQPGMGMGMGMQPGMGMGGMGMGAPGMGMGMQPGMGGMGMGGMGMGGMGGPGMGGMGGMGNYPPY